MNRNRNDPKVKKTLVRNYEHIPKSRKQAVANTAASSTKVPETSSHRVEKENELNKPSLCSSEIFANYLCDVQKMEPPLPVDDESKCQNYAKMTKKLNFHFNDKIYRNLIELNANVDLKSKKDKKPSCGVSTKRDVEPNIEDFYEDVEEKDVPQSIPIIKPKYKPVKQIENGELHKLVASFENL